MRKRQNKKTKTENQKNNTSNTQFKERKRPGRKPTGKRYFTNITEIAILAYNKTKDPLRRNKIYVRFIRKPFDKMVEILINKYKYSYTGMTYEDLKHSVMVHMLEKIHMYRAEAGKAFSYFNRMAKNWLIQNNQKSYKRGCLHDDIEKLDIKRNVPGEYYSDNARERKKEFLDEFTDFLEDNLTTFFNNKRDIAIADSLILLMRQRELIENYNKKALYILVRERCRITDKETLYITKVLNVFKEHFITKMKEYEDHGTISPIQNNFFS